MDMEHILLRCVHMLTVTRDMDVAIRAFLKELGVFCEADRYYIIEYSKKKGLLYNKPLIGMLSVGMTNNIGIYNHLVLRFK